MSEQSFLGGRVIVKLGEGTEGINTVAYLPELELAADAFMDNILNDLPFQTITRPSATATIDKVVTITEADTVSQGNPSQKIARSSGGSRSIPINLSYKWGRATEEFEEAEVKTYNRDVVGGAMKRVAQGCERYLTFLVIDTLDTWFTADAALSTGKNQIISSAVGYQPRGTNDAAPANFHPIQTANKQPMNYAKIIAADDILAYNVAMGMFSDQRCLIGPYRSLQTQLRGDPAIQHRDWRPEDSRANQEVVERSPIGSSRVYSGMFGGYKVESIPPVGKRTGPFLTNRTELTGGTSNTNQTDLTTVFMCLDNAIINYVLEGFPEMYMTMRSNPNYERTMNVTGITNKTPNIFYKEHIVPILCSVTSSAALADGLSS